MPGIFSDPFEVFTKSDGCERARHKDDGIREEVFDRELSVVTVAPEWQYVCAGSRGRSAYCFCSGRQYATQKIWNPSDFLRDVSSQINTDTDDCVTSFIASNSADWASSCTAWE